MKAFTLLTHIVAESHKYPLLWCLNSFGAIYKEIAPTEACRYGSILNITEQNYVKPKFYEGILDILITKYLHIWEVLRQLYSSFLNKGLNLTVSVRTQIVNIWTPMTQKAYRNNKTLYTLGYAKIAGTYA